MLAQGPPLIETYAYRVSYDRLVANRLRPHAWARIASRILGPKLDRSLIVGADPSGSAVLAARAAFLASSSQRAGMADAIEGILDAAHGPQRRWWAVLRHAPVRANADGLASVAELLRSRRPLYVRGIAAVNQLLTDGCGPLYGPRAEYLRLQLRDAYEAMVG
jgi:hypothetical protein